MRASPCPWRLPPNRARLSSAALGEPADLHVLGAQPPSRQEAASAVSCPERREPAGRSGPAPHSRPPRTSARRSAPLHSPRGACFGLRQDVGLQPSRFLMGLTWSFPLRQAGLGVCPLSGLAAREPHTCALFAFSPRVSSKSKEPLSLSARQWQSPQQLSRGPLGGR